MHILIALLGIIVTGVIWYQRIKVASEAGGKAVDAAQRAHGRVKRKRRRDQAAFAPISAIDDPVIAGATLMRFVAGDERWGLRRTDVREFLATVADEPSVDEAIAYAEWAARQVEHERKSIDALSGKLGEWLDPTERDRLIGMLDTVAENDVDAIARAERSKATLDRHN